MTDKDQTDSTDLFSMPVRDFLAAVADKTPTPGGGSVAGVVAGLAVALGEMALNYTRGKKSFAEHQQLHEHLAGRLGRAREMCLGLVAEDVQAYQLYVEAKQMPAGADKDAAVQLALSAAIDVPRELAKVCLAVLNDLQSLTDKCNPHLVSDLRSGASLAEAAVRLCHYNVEINAAGLIDRQAAEEVVASSQWDLGKAKELLENIENG